MNNLKVIATKGNSLGLWLKYHDPLDIRRNNPLYADFLTKHPMQLGEWFDNYIGSFGWLANCGFSMDRTNRNLNYLNFHFEPIPEVEPSWNKTIEQVLLERAEEIWNMNRPVRLWWSGGIDSTAALVAFLRTKKPEHELTIYYGQPCIEENPHFWSLLQKIDDLKFQSNNMETIFDFEPNFTDGSINVTGEPGDPVWGSFAIKEHMNKTESHWTDIFKYEDTRYNFRDADKKTQNKFIEFCEWHISASPVEIRNPFDFIWWVAFSCKWQWNDLTPHRELKNASRYYNIIGFYNFPEIQKWSIVNHDLKHRGDYKSYKGPAKDFIFDYDGNTEYRDNKTKYMSFPDTYPMREEIGVDSRESYSRQFINSLIMSDGSYHKEVFTGEDYGFGYDPEINLYDRWDIYYKPVWDEWKKQL